MKRFNLLSVVVALVLVVTAVSCTTTRGTEDGYYYDRSASAPNRVYVDDPYRGTVVLERDPYSGRYYEVNTYGNRNYYRGNSVYYNRNYNSRNYNNRNYNRNYNRNNGYYNNSQDVQKPAKEQKKDYEKSREQARRKILGD
jgi:hypothetical protein